MQPTKTIKIGKRSFIFSCSILLVLMIFSGILTRIIPAGHFERIMEDSREVIVNGSFEFIPSPDYPIYRWFSAPFEVLFSDNSLQISVIIGFILLIGASFYLLDASGLIQFMMQKLVERFKDSKTKLIYLVVLIFMLFGSLFGIFEELIALTPLCIALSLSFGWDELTGLSISALAAGFGFASAILNPFTLGAAQSLAGLPSFSGILLRIAIFVLVYLLLTQFIFWHIRKIEMEPKGQSTISDSEALEYTCKNPTLLWHGVKVFVSFQLAILICVTLGFFIPILSDITLPIVAILFFIASLSSARITNYVPIKQILKDLLKGILNISPAALLILMAASIKLIIQKGEVLDTLIYYLSQYLLDFNAYYGILIIFALILILNFFIASGSAKAFLIIPLLVPITDLLGITRQSLVQAFIFGDGFSNLIYPTNATLLIALGISGVSYTKWFRFILPLQIILLIVSTLILLLCVAIGYGPF